MRFSNSDGSPRWPWRPRWRRRSRCAPRLPRTDSPDPAHTTTVTGRLIDADGKPVAGGQVVVMAEHWARFERPLGVYSHNDLPITFRVTGPVRTDREGRFRIEAPSARRGPSGIRWSTGRPRATVWRRSSSPRGNRPRTSRSSSTAST